MKTKNWKQNEYYWHTDARQYLRCVLVMNIWFMQRILLLILTYLLFLCLHQQVGRVWLFCSLERKTIMTIAGRVGANIVFWIVAVDLLNNILQKVGYAKWNLHMKHHTTFTRCQVNRVLVSHGTFKKLKCCQVLWYIRSYTQGLLKVLSDAKRHFLEHVYERPISDYIPSGFSKVPASVWMV